MADKMNPVNWFEIPATDLNRAKAFYENILDIELSLNTLDSFKMAWFPMVENGAGSTGALVESESYVPSHEGSMVYFSVEDIEKVLNKVEDQGGKVLDPKMSIGEYGFVAHFEDSEGNRVALHSMQ